MKASRSLHRAAWTVVLALGLSSNSVAGQPPQTSATGRPLILEGDTVPDLIVTPNSGAVVSTVIDGASLNPLGSGYPFGPDFAGGVRAALGDLTGDGVADLVFGTGPGGGLVTLIDGASIAPIGSGQPFGPFGGGVNVALGDFDNDGRLDIVATQASAGGTVSVFNGATYAPILSIRPFGPDYAGGVTIATGDVDGDGLTDLVVGQVNGSLLSVVSGATRAVTLSGVPFGANGVFVAAGDVTGDGRAEIVAAPGQGSGPVIVFDVRTMMIVALLAPYDASVSGGVRIAATDLDGDGRTEILMVPGPGSPAVLKIFDGASLTLSRSIQVYPAGFLGGAFIAASNVKPLRFSSLATANFTVGAPSSFTVQLIGAPAGVSITSTGVLPAGVTFTDNGNGTATLGGTPSGPGGAFPLTFGARVGAGAPVVQSFVLTVRQQPAFTSAPLTTFTVGAAGTFTITTTGFPAANVTATGILPTGVTLSSNGDGTATLAGTPAPGSGGSYPLTLSGSNGTGTAATQAFTLTVTGGTVFTSATAITFRTGVAGSFTVVTTGSPAATITVNGALPNGVTFTSNGDGTATLAGVPGAGTGGVYGLTFSAVSNGGTPITQGFTLTVNQAPALTSPGSTTFATGTPGTFAVTTSGFPASALTVAGALPSGIVFTPHAGGTGTLAGTAAPGTVGTYALTFTADNGVGPAVMQAFSLTISSTVIAGDDAYVGAIGNTQFSVGGSGLATPAVTVAGSVLDNDTAAAPVILAVTVPPAHGQVVLANTGSFMYTPNPGFTGPSDSFTYSLTDTHNASDTATVSIGLSGVVWYVSAAASPGGDGRSHAPFGTISAAVAAAGTGPIYIGAGNYSGAVALAAGQRLWGAGTTFVLGGLTIPASTTPLLTGSINLADGVQLNSLAIAGGGATAIAGGSSITGAVTLTGVSIVSGAVGLSLTNTPGNVTVVGGTFSGVSGPEVLLDGGSGVVAIGAAITSTAGRSIEVKNRTAGTVTFSAAIADTAGGILLNNNTGSTLAFTGGMNLSTTSDDAFSAIAGGTVTVTQDNTTIVNTLTTTSGTALRVENTNIGAAGLTFRSITAGTGSDTGGVGIVVDDTGTAGRLIVSGNGPLPVGTPIGTAPTGGRVRNKTGGDGSTTSGIGIYLNATLNPSFSWMEITGFENSGIFGLNVTGFELIDSIVAGAGTTVGAHEGPVVFGLPVSIDHPLGVGGLIGTALIRNSVIRSGYEHNLLIFNNQPSTVLNLQIDRTNGIDGGCQIGPNSSTTGGDGLFVKLEGTAAANITVDQCRFRSNRAAGVQANAVGGSHLTVVVTNSEINAAEQGVDGIVVTNADDSHVTSTLANNVFNGFSTNAIRVGQATLSATAASSFSGSIVNNTVFHPLLSPDGAIVARLSSTPGLAAPTRLMITGNSVIQRGPSAGIIISTPDAAATPRVDVSMSGNHVDMDDPNSPASPGARGPYGIALSIDHVDATFGLCANIVNNTTHWYPPGVGAGGGFLVTRVGAAQVRLERGFQPLATAFDVVLRDNNLAGPGGASAVTVVGAFGPTSVVENGSCLVP